MGQYFSGQGGAKSAVQLAALLSDSILAEFFPVDEVPRDDGVPWFMNLDTADLEEDGKAYPLESFAGLGVLRRADKIYLREGGAERFLAETARPLDPDWPWPAVAVADIDFDGKPEFFILNRPGYTGSGYMLVDAQGGSAIGQTLFVPFDSAVFASSPQLRGQWLLYDQGSGGMPGFLPEQKILEFYVKNGPFYDTERWCFSGSRYYLCEKWKQTYYPGADNNDLVFLYRVRFDRQGGLAGVSCHPLNDDTFGPLRFTAFVDVPLHDSPAASGKELTPISAGTIVSVLDYRVEDGENGNSTVLWYNVRNDNNPKQTGWCRVLLEQPKVRDGKVVFTSTYNPDVAAYMENPYPVLSAKRTKSGAELRVRGRNNATMRVENIPAMFPFHAI